MTNPENLTKYAVTMELLVQGNPRKWLSETISEALYFHDGEDILNIEIEELKQTDEI